MAVLITNEVSRNPKSEIQTNSWLCSKKQYVNTPGLETLEMYKIEMLSTVQCVLTPSSLSSKIDIRHATISIEGFLQFK